MVRTEQLLQLSLDGETTVALVTHVLTKAGLHVQRSFDLQSACASFTDNVCPHHGDTPCDCQLVVLLVYLKESRPVSLIIHSHRGTTELGIADGFGQSPPLELAARVRSILRNVNSIAQTEMKGEPHVP